MSGISATASVRRRFARKTDYVIIYGSVSLAQVRQPSRLSKVMNASESPAWAAATMDCSLSKWVGIFGEGALRGGCSRTAFHHITQMDQFANSRTAAKNSCGLMTTNWRTFRKAQFGGRIL